MVWFSRKEIRSWMQMISDRLEIVEEQVFALDNSDRLDGLHDKINSLLNDSDRCEEAILSVAVLDKFADYMKNVDKLNAMINEFKGCVALARSALSERRDADKETVKARKKSATVK